MRLSGCTVHFVTAELDAGPIIAQAAVPVLADDTEDTLAARVLRRGTSALPAGRALVRRGPHLGGGGPSCRQRRSARCHPALLDRSLVRYKSPAIFNEEPTWPIRRTISPLILQTYHSFSKLVLFAILFIVLLLSSMALGLIGSATIFALLLGVGGTVALLVAFAVLE